MDSQQIVNEIVQYITDCGGDFQNWYVGIASNPRDRLFNQHAVVEKGGAWVFLEAANDSADREIEEFLVTTYQTKGGSGGGDNTTKYVYAYRVTASTRE
jgi:hypothetical protein